MSVPSPPWWARRGLDVVLSQWLDPAFALSSPWVVDHTMAAIPARMVDVPLSLPEPVRNALRHQQIERLYVHQREAYEAALRGQHVAIATPTASGKSLCFHLPVLHAIFDDPDARALYLFPTKALARDQEASLQTLLRAATMPHGIGVYDGDTAADARRVTRERAAVLLTNPDMLHASILPQHAKWAAWFRGLRYVIVDELHTYRGVFGSHLANVFARLRRVARFHGADPQFLCASATIGNVTEHATRLLGLDQARLQVVTESGAPRSPRRVLVYNPPVVNAELGIRASYLKSGVRLAADLLRAQVPTLVFAPSRNGVEIVLKYLREACAGDIPPEAIMGYRGGYLPAVRRQIEGDLRGGKLRGVVATHALELGIDVGELEAVVSLGYPGSVAALWQRFGRAGRREGESVAVLVASSSPLDQYVVRHPEFFLERSPEEARIDPANPEILLPHLRCAAFEMPFFRGDAFGSLSTPDTNEALDYLVRHGSLRQAGLQYHWAADAFPAHQVSLRSTGWENFVIIDQATGKAIAELDWRAAHTMLHERAIYQHNAEQYEVERLHYENHKAFVRPVRPDYFTTAMLHSSVRVLDEQTATLRPYGRSDSPHPITVGWGDISVTEKVVGFKKITFFTHENVGYGEVNLPEMQMDSVGVWLTLPPRFFQHHQVGRAAAVDGLRGIGVTLTSVGCLALLCEPRDLRHTLGDGTRGDAPPTNPDGRWNDPYRTFEPTLFVYDAYPGGVGLAARMFERLEELLARSRELIEQCDCAQGCPACVGPGDDVTTPNPKRTALRILSGLVP